MEERQRRATYYQLWEGYRQAARLGKWSRPRYDVFLSLTAFRGDGDTVGRPTATIANECEMSVVSVRKHIAALTHTEFEGPGGVRMTFITPLTAAVPGRCATYRVNVPRESW